MNPNAQPFQPSKFHTSSPPRSSQLNAGAASFAPPVTIRQPTLGWPPEQPPLSDSKWNHLHPSEIPDSVFLNEHSMSKRSTSWLHLKDPFGGNGFQPSLMPWWTHWCIVFAHEKTKLDDCDIAKMYKHRYRDVIPGIQHMGTADALELYNFLRNRDHQYASKWDPEKEDFLRNKILHNLEEAETFAQEARRQKKVRSPGVGAGRSSS